MIEQSLRSTRFGCGDRGTVFVAFVAVRSRHDGALSDLAIGGRRVDIWLMAWRWFCER